MCRTQSITGAGFVAGEAEADVFGTLHGLLRQHPEWWRHLAVAIGEYADIAANASSDLMIPENERRVVNVSRNTLGTILRSLQDAGLISIGYGKIRPLQPEKLRALVESA